MGLKNDSFQNKGLEDLFSLEFSDHINILLGQNGTGKTSLLKMLYSASQFSNRQTSPGMTDHLHKYFSENLNNSEVLKNSHRKDSNCCYAVSDGNHKFKSSLSDNGIFGLEQWMGLEIPSVFIPSTEMLSHSQGLLA